MDGATIKFVAHVYRNKQNTGPEAADVDGKTSYVFLSETLREVLAYN